ncbi:MAG: hypothetical protein HND48_23405 [Chloroflexi bacterium]|nr:hypothetical protein [Chloroflexota bacterium]
MLVILGIPVLQMKPGRRGPMACNRDSVASGAGFAALSARHAASERGAWSPIRRARRAI